MKYWITAAVLFLATAAHTAVTAIVTPPGGDNTEVQYNNNRRFDGDPDFTFNGTTVTMTGLSISTGVIPLINGSIAFSGPRPFVDPIAYGAIPDDGVDDTTAMAAAIATGGDVRLSSGTYLITISNPGTSGAPLKLRSNQTLSGAGHQSIIKQNGAHLGAGTGYLICNVDTTNGNTDISVHDLTIQMTAPTVVGSAMTAWSVALELEGVKRLKIHNNYFLYGSIDIRTGDGIINTPTALTGSARTSDIEVHHNVFHYPPGQCPTLFEVTHAQVHNNQIRWNYDSGISILGAGYDVEVASNYVDRSTNTVGAGHQIEITMDSSVVADNPYTTPGRGVSMSDIRIINNTVYGSTNVAAGNTNNGISFSGKIENATISGNHIYTAKNQGIHATNYKRNCKIDNNIVKGNGGVGILWSDDGSIAHSHNSISLNMVSNNGSTATTPSGITIGDTGSVAMDDFKVVGNQCWDDQASPTQVRGMRLNVTNGLTNSVISSNDVSGTTDDIEIIGANSLYSTSMIWINMGFGVPNFSGPVTMSSNTTNAGTFGVTGTVTHSSHTYITGNLGIGVTPASGILHLKGTNPVIYLQDAGDGTPRKFAELDSSQNLILNANVGQKILFYDRDNATQVAQINTSAQAFSVGTTVTTGKINALGADNATVYVSSINAAQAGVTTADVFMGFYSNTGLEGSVAGTAVAGVIAFNTFTGAHWTRVKSFKTKTQVESNVLAPMCSTGERFYVRDAWDSTVAQKKRTRASDKEQLVMSEPCTEPYAKSIYGFYAGRDENSGQDTVLSLGTGLAWVSNTGTDVQAGDWLVTAGDGKTLQIQMTKIADLAPVKDDIQRNYSAAKATQTIKWMAGEKKRKIAVTYHAG